MTDRKDVAITVRLPADVYDQLKRLADAQDRTMSGVLRWLVREHFRGPATPAKR